MTNKIPNLLMPLAFMVRKRSSDHIAAIKYIQNIIFEKIHVIYVFILKWEFLMCM